MVRRVFLAFLVFGLMACGDDGAGPDPIACTDDTGTVAVTVSAGLQPMFNWEPACAMALLLVEAGSGDVWGISTDNATWDDPAQANLIAPPITYGVAPASAPEVQAPDPLASGATYALILWRVRAAGSTTQCVARIGNLGNVCVMAIHEFTLFR